MALISTKLHGVLDYVVSGALVAAPDVLGIDDEPRAALAPRLQGAGSAAYTVFTDHELGLVKLIPMPVHLLLDAVGGAFLAASPWLLGFAKRGPRYWAPHVAVGASEVLVAALTERRRGNG